MVSKEGHRGIIRGWRNCGVARESAHNERSMKLKQNISRRKKMTDDEAIFDEQFAREVKEKISSIDGEYQKFFASIKGRLPISVQKLVLRRIARSNFEVYNFFFELIAADIGAEAAEKIFSGDREDRKLDK